VESLHPFACLTLLPNAEVVSIAWQNFKEEEWPLPPRPHLTSLSFRCSSASINFGQFKTLFTVFSNIEDLQLHLGTVTGFDEMVTDFLLITVRLVKDRLRMVRLG
jgi:hypothetical protein